ncbi:MAG: hypothetical protein MRY74_06300 [Neomegalonema sp.]|nr:hypothetical protein [Neomegalonema sp.]
MLAPLIFALILLSGLIVLSTRRFARIRRLEEQSVPLRDQALHTASQSLFHSLNMAPIQLRVANTNPVEPVIRAREKLLIAAWLVDKLKYGELTTDEAAFVVARSTGAMVLANSCFEDVVAGLLDLARLQLRNCSGAEANSRSRMFLCMILSHLLKRFKRRALEADAFGALLMQRSGLDPYAALTYLAKIQAWSTQRDQTTPQHHDASAWPAAFDERIQFVQSALSEKRVATRPIIELDGHDDRANS